MDDGFCLMYSHNFWRPGPFAAPPGRRVSPALACVLRRSSQCCPAARRALRGAGRDLLGRFPAGSCDRSMRPAERTTAVGGSVEATSASSSILRGCVVARKTRKRLVASS
eukprot:scaffold7031_cov254-Pinguiococcus_pyrenoidosus.AAC.5